MTQFDKLVELTHTDNPEYPLQCQEVCNYKEWFCIKIQSVLDVENYCPEEVAKALKEKGRYFGSCKWC